MSVLQIQKDRMTEIQRDKNTERQDAILQFLHCAFVSIICVDVFRVVSIIRWQLVSFCFEPDLSDILMHNDALMHFFRIYIYAYIDAYIDTSMIH